MPVFWNGHKKLLFVHVPKTGGTYIEDLFRANGYRVYFWERGDLIDQMCCSPQHYHADILRTLFRLSAFDHVFMTVRHPLKRMISEYRMRQEKGEKRPFHDWAPATLLKAQDDPFYLDNHIRPQADFRMPGVDIHRQEDAFNADWAKRLNAQHGLGFQVMEVPRRRENPDFHRTFNPDDIPASVRKAIEAYYDADYRSFDYGLTP
ncbi:sulfotransferase family 2 domain-containing protein [Eilatimonas milleporae]|uniref:Sulfotransferase family protein n=1 Tax=Eilatimonas milleporae TaxID=911205 RepID=A0A3M0CTX2_9PROT|nr:sulfotransferase family 2 domain-containing protein [Eilatimonas milleporae]RMB12425.1 sulfotransferase family protein [Eilatimonas milleporae]